MSYSLVQKVRSSHRLTQIIILTSFLFSFLIIRIITNFQRAGIIPNQTGLLHVHHLVPGIILSLIGGYFGLSFGNIRIVRLFSSMLFGIGAALTIDEFALWLYLKDVYWLEDGRRSIDAVIISIALLTIGFVLSEIHDHAWLKFFRKRS